MKHALDPTRLADLEAGDQRDLGSAIRALRSHAASASEVEALGRRLAPQLSVPSGVGAGGVGADGGSAALGVSAKWIGVLLIAAAVGLYAMVQRGKGGAESARSSAGASAPLHATAPSPQAPAPPEQASASAVTAAAAPAPPIAVRAPSTAKHSHLHVPPLAPPLASNAAPDAELTLLAQAQATLDRDAGAALALAERHARFYPSGVFVQEREILAIEALLKLRQRPAAVARAAQFVQRYPDSPHARRVRSLLERSTLAPQPTIAPASDHSSTDIQP